MDLKKYIYGHCVSPISMPIFDAYTQSMLVQKVPCGKCLHCRNTHLNEWVTRLYAQSMYSNFVYFITLDYAPFSYVKDTFTDSVAESLSIETAACWNNINKYKRYGMQPLLLVKSHLQKFFKRFRKNTHKKIQYFACGEYGTHADGHGFGRPHFHAIIFSDSAITLQEFEDAWTLDGYKIGNIDYYDITAQAKCTNIHSSLMDAKYCFKYVCKYLQKSDFDFQKLATIDFHRAYFDSLQYVATKTETLFPEYERINDSKVLEDNWQEYTAKYSPFIVCSRRPSIGIAYLQDNLERFKNYDFRLFGLPQEVQSFPRYFVRKTKESLCDFDVLGKKSLLPASSSPLGGRLSVLYTLQNILHDFAFFDGSAQFPWNIVRNSQGIKGIDFGSGFMPLSSFHFYDRKNKIMYQFNGSYYTLWVRVRKLGFVRLCELGVYDVLNEVQPQFNNLFEHYISRSHASKILQERELASTISTLYEGRESEKMKKFERDVYAYYLNELSLRRKKDLLSNNSKIEF